jgi:hypothetical protein
MIYLREAIEASWGSDTANPGTYQQDNPARGQCYPTSRVMQFHYPWLEIVSGKVQTSAGVEDHFWCNGGDLTHFDWTWQQFPVGSRVLTWRVRDRLYLNDGDRTLLRVSTLTERVRGHLDERGSR